MSDYMEGYNEGYDAAADRYADRIAEIEAELAAERKLKNIYFDEWQDANARERGLREALERARNQLPEHRREYFDAVLAETGGGYE